MYRCIGVAMMLIGSLGHRFIGIGVSMYRCIGVLMYRCIGVLESWFIASSVHWYRCIGVSMSGTRRY